MTTQVLRPILLLAALAVVLAPVAVVAQVCYTETDGTKHFVTSKNDVPAALRATSCAPAVPTEPASSVAPSPKAESGALKTIAPSCLAGIDRLVTSSGGKFTKLDVRRELGPDCEEQFTAMLQHNVDLTQACSDAFRSGFDNGDPYRIITRSELMAVTRPECRDLVERAWNELEREGKTFRAR